MKKRYFLLIISLMLSFIVFCFSGCQAVENWFNDIIQSEDNSKDDINGGVDTDDIVNNGNGDNPGGSNNSGGNNNSGDTECKHSFVYGVWQHTELVHYQYKRCQYCSYSERMPTEAHTFKYYVCTVCGYVDTAKHTHELVQGFKCNSFEHHKYLYCSCGYCEDVDEAPERHTFVGYVCKICGYDKSPGTNYV